MEPSSEETNDETFLVAIDDERTPLICNTTEAPLSSSCMALPSCSKHRRYGSVAVYRTLAIQWALKYFLPIGPCPGIFHHLSSVFLGFALSLAISILWPWPGRIISNVKFGEVKIAQSLCVCCVFFISGLAFRTADIKGAIGAPAGIVFGVLSILMITPTSGFLISALSFVPHHYRVGLCVFVSVPTTLTMGVALLEHAGGNAALGLMLTIVSNVAGILTVPFAVRWTIGSSSNASIDPTKLLLKLSLTVLIPLALGKALLEMSSTISRYIGQHRTLLSVMKNGSCVAIVWLSMSHSRSELISQRLKDIAVLVVLYSVIHICFLVFNLFCSYILQIRGRERMAVVIMASQKTFPVCLAVISYLDPNNVGDLGLLTIPCIVAHMTQLFIDSIVLSKWQYDRVGDS